MKNKMTSWLFSFSSHKFCDNHPPLTFESSKLWSMKNSLCCIHGLSHLKSHTAICLGTSPTWKLGAVLVALFSVSFVTRFLHFRLPFSESLQGRGGRGEELDSEVPRTWRQALKQQLSSTRTRMRTGLSSGEPMDQFLNGQKVLPISRAISSYMFHFYIK